MEREGDGEWEGGRGGSGGGRGPRCPCPSNWPDAVKPKAFAVLPK